MFEYAFQAAVKRTRIEYEAARRSLPGYLVAKFADMAG
jgi:hypothetical protein